MPEAPVCLLVLCVAPVCVYWSCVEHRCVLTAPLTSVEHAEAAALQGGEHLRRLPAEVLEAGRYVVVHRKPADLLDRLVLPQQVGLHRQRHCAPSRKRIIGEEKRKRASFTLEHAGKFVTQLLFFTRLFTSWNYHCKNKYRRVCYWSAGKAPPTHRMAG